MIVNDFLVSNDGFNKPGIGAVITNGDFHFLPFCESGIDKPNVELTGGALAPSSDRRERG